MTWLRDRELGAGVDNDKCAQNIRSVGCREETASNVTIAA